MMALLATPEFQLPGYWPPMASLPDFPAPVFPCALPVVLALREVVVARPAFGASAVGIFAFLCALVLLPPASPASGAYYTDKTKQLPIDGISSGAAGPTMDVAVADLNGDGFRDIVLAHEFVANVILLNNGKGSFTNATNGRLPQARQDSEDIAIADFDGDGDLDLLFVTEDDISHATGELRKHEYYLNDGKGVFTAAAYSFPDSKANAVAAADITGDGFPDVLIGNDGQDFLLINDGKGGFTDETSARLPVVFDITQDVKFADLDGDSDLDILAGNEDRNRLYINNGKGVFTDESMDRLPQNTSLETRKVTIGDVNGDGAPDIFLANVSWRPGKVVRNRLYINNGKGVFADETTTRLPEDSEFTLDGIFADVDLDGDPDLVTVNVQQLPYKIYLNNGKGTFGEAAENILPAVYSGAGLAVIAADFDGDGIDDLYFGNRDRRDNLLLHTGESTGMAEPPVQHNNLRLFPNPCGESVRVQYAGTAAGISRVEIFSQLGACLYGAKTELSTDIVCPVDDLPSGAYTLCVQAGDDRIARSFIRE